MVLRLLLGPKHKRTIVDWLIDATIALGVGLLAYGRLRGFCS